MFVQNGVGCVHARGSDLCDQVSLTNRTHHQVEAQMSDPANERPTELLIREWIDKLAIREVLERYMRYNDDRASTRMVELLDENVVFQVVGRRYVGRESVLALFNSPSGPNPPEWHEPGQLLVQPGSVHIAANPIIELEGDTARSELDFMVAHRDHQGHTKISLIGRYRDHLRKLNDGRWVITRRVGVSVARPGEERTDAEWQRLIARMPESERVGYHSG
jgi:SnoaL-like domain